MVGAKGEQGRVVGHVAAGKDEGRLLFVEARDLVLQDLVEYGVAPDVPRASGPDSIVNGAQNCDVLKHDMLISCVSSCIITNPPRDILGTFLGLRKDPEKNPTFGHFFKIDLFGHFFFRNNFFKVSLKLFFFSATPLINSFSRLP